MSAEPVLSADRVSRRYVSRFGTVTALEDVSFQAQAGACVGLVGRSGSGKTTLLTLIGLLDRPDGGELTVLGQCARSASPDRLSRHRRGAIGYLFQDAGLIARARVIDSVTLPLRYAGVRASEREQRACEALESVELSDKHQRRVGDLSGGERQRVGLARAMALRPKLLVCDEPTAPLDAATSKTVAHALRNHAERGCCVIVATHDPLLMDAMDRTYTLENGRLRP